MTKQEILNKADYYRNEMIKNGPINLDQLAEIDQYFRVVFTYSSNSIEGNSLTLTEVKKFLEEGITADERPRKEYEEVTGHTEAYNDMLSSARLDKLEITEALIKKLHLLLYQNVDQEQAGQFRNIKIERSTLGNPPPIPEEIPHFMGHFINQIETSRRFMHPIEFAAICHKRLIDIHPFNEGNGRIARLFMNLILVNAGYGTTTIPPELGDEYTKALKLSQNVNNPDIDTLIKFIAERVIESERECCRILQIDCISC